MLSRDARSVYGDKASEFRFMRHARAHGRKGAGDTSLRAAGAPGHYRRRDRAMNLRAFIKQALLDIVGGVEDAQNEIKAGEIVPYVEDSYKSVEVGIHNLQPVEFDVSVSAGAESGSEARISVVAAVIGGGAKGSSNASSGHVANLKFKIPVKLPHKKDPEAETQ